MKEAGRMKEANRTKGWMWFSATVLAGAGIALTAWLLSSPPDGDATGHIKAAQRLLDQAHATRTVPAAWDGAPLPLPEVRDAHDRKTLFIATLLPLIVAENARIADQRARARTARAGTPAYAALAYAYGLDPRVERSVLLRRIDIVPAALALAQGAIESGWGTSRFAREGHAYFGLRTFDPDTPGLAPGDASGFKVQRFASPRLSVRTFFKTLNTHPAYRGLRHARANIRAAGRRPTGLELAPHLKGYSEIGAAYIGQVTAAIRTNGLSRYNGLALAGQ